MLSVKSEANEPMFEQIIQSVLNHQKVKQIEYNQSGEITIQFYENSGEESSDTSKHVVNKFKHMEQPVLKPKMQLKERIVSIKNVPKLNFGAWDFRKGYFAEESIRQKVLELIKRDLMSGAFWTSYELLMKAQKKDSYSGVESALNKVYTKFNCDKDKFYKFIEGAIESLTILCVTSSEFVQEYIKNNSCNIEKPLLHTAVAKLACYYKISYILNAELEVQQEYIDLYSK